MLNIVVPMAGHGSRFKTNGYLHPKPLINVNGKHMIEVVINNLKPDCEHRFIFVCQNEHIKEYKLRDLFAKSCDNFVIVGINGVTEGAAITVLKAKEYINNSDPLMIANSDQWIDTNINDYLFDMKKRKLQGSMLTMTANDPKWSFAKVNSDGLVTEVVEKIVISNEATVGIYNFTHGSDFCEFSEQMIEKNIRCNGEFYVAPVYTYMAQAGKNIGIYNIGKEGSGMYGLGIPSDLEFFINNKICKKATDF